MSRMLKMCDFDGKELPLQKNDVIGYAEDGRVPCIQVFRSFEGELFHLYFRGKKKNILYSSLPGPFDEAGFRGKAAHMASQVGLQTISINCKQLPEYTNLTWACEVC